MTHSVESIFNAALEKPGEAERNAFLDGACRENDDLRARVETLLRAHEDAGHFLEQTTSPSVAEGAGSRLDRYKLLQVIGEGGFGIVYMAEQVEPVRRKVAIKIIKLGMDTRQVVARFESERQALALMDHPNIARVLDAGSTESGRPYFVMELVRGIPLTEYCDQNQLRTAERLELFIAVCHAVQHAHQKGIIHRDLKPSNILVTLHDGKPVPKVIDFGIAKATNQRLTEKTLFTEFRQFIGTPQYMSPEQAEMSGLDVDTRSDIYSLGVILYELLTGTTPFDSDRLRTAGYIEMQRILREEEPVSPSVRVSTMRNDLETIAKHRSMDAAALRRAIAGDLDWIVMKALEKDRTRRYETARDLAGDLQRHLQHQPVQAGPPGTWYRVRKFVRRHRFRVMAGAVMLAAVLSGMGLAASGFVQARREAARSQAIADFLQEILASIDPEDAARRNLDVARVEARARELFGQDHATVAATLSSLALQLQHGGNLAAAESLYRESLQIWRMAYGENHVNVGITLSRLGTLRKNLGDDSGAEEALRESLRVTQGLTGDAQRLTCDARCSLADILKRRGKLDEAETLLREVLNIRRANPQGQQFEIATTLEQLLAVLIQTRKDQQTDQVFEEMLQAFRPMFPPDSSTIAVHNLGYAVWLRQHERGDKAEGYLRSALRIYRNMKNPPREYYLLALDNLFQIVRKRDESLDESISIFTECIENMGYVYGRDHLMLAPHLIGFARLLEDRNRSAEAIPFLVDGIRIFRTAKGPDANLDMELRTLEQAVHRVVLAAGLSPEKYSDALGGARTILAEQPDSASGKLLLAMAQYRQGEWDSARVGLAEDLQDREKIDEQFHIQRLLMLAMAVQQSGDSPRAQQLFAEANARSVQVGNALSRETRLLVSEAGALISGEKPREEQATQN